MLQPGRVCKNRLVAKVARSGACAPAHGGQGPFTKGAAIADPAEAQNPNIEKQKRHCSYRNRFELRSALDGDATTTKGHLSLASTTHLETTPCLIPMTRCHIEWRANDGESSTEASLGHLLVVRRRQDHALAMNEACSTSTWQHVSWEGPPFHSNVRHIWPGSSFALGC